MYVYYIILYYTILYYITLYYSTVRSAIIVEMLLLYACYHGPLPPEYTRSPLEDSCLFGPSPWKILATTYEQMNF